MRWIYVLASLLTPAEPPLEEEGPAKDEPASTGSKGTPARVTVHPSISYPEAARRAGVEGTVVVRIFVDTNGRLVPRKDPACRGSSMSPEERRESFFAKRWCVEATSGPDALRTEAVLDWVTSARFEPATGASGTAIRSYLKMTTVYKLR